MGEETKVEFKSLQRFLWERARATENFLERPVEDRMTLYQKWAIDYLKEKQAFDEEQIKAAGE